MLLGDADVVEPLRERLRERVQAGRSLHRGGDRHEVGALAADLHQGVGEHVRPGAAGGLDVLAGDRVDDARGVHLVRLVVLGRREPHALAGDRVHDHRSAERLRALQCGLQRRLVVAVDRADVLETQVLEHRLRRQRVLDAALGGVQRGVQRLAEERRLLQGALALLQHALVAGAQAQRRQVVRETADRRRVRAAVVVDHDHDRTRLVRRDVVQRLPAHAAGQRAVADDRDHVAALAVDLLRLRQTVGVGQRRRGVRALLHVVLGLRPRRVAGHAALLAQPVEAVAPARDDLVHVRLVPGVEHDRVPRRVEHAMQRHGQLDDTQVRAEVPAGPGDLVDQKTPDLVAELLQLRFGHPFQISRSVHGLQQGHHAHLTPQDFGSVYGGSTETLS